MLPPRACLNAVRILSIVGLLLVFASSIFVLVNDVKAFNAFESAKQSGELSVHVVSNCDYIEGSTVPNQAAGIFWAVVSRLLLIFEVVILLMSEVGWPMKFFDNFFPVLGRDFGLGALGIFECLIGAQILSHHVDDFTLVAAFFLFSIGCVNMLLGLIFRESAKTKRSITSWRAEKKGILPTVHDSRSAFVNASPQFAAPTYTGASSEKAYEAYNSFSRSDSRAGLGFGRQGEKAAGLKGFLITKPEETLPRYATRPKSSHRESSVHSESPRSSIASFESRPAAAPASGHSTAPPTFKSSNSAI